MNPTDFKSWETIAAIVSAVIGLLTVGGAVFRWREQSLRREDVQDWANEAIAALQSLVLLTALPPGRTSPGFTSTTASPLSRSQSATSSIARCASR